MPVMNRGCGGDRGLQLMLWSRKPGPPLCTVAVASKYPSDVVGAIGGVLQRHRGRTRQLHHKVGVLQT